MAYCTDTDIQHRKGERFLLQMTVGEDENIDFPDQDVIDAAIEWADAEIDAEFAMLYASYLPFSPVPPVVKNFSVTFAAYWLAQRYKELYDPTQARSKEYDEARARLREYATGKLPLVLSDGTVLSQAQAITRRGQMKRANTDDPIYSRDTLEDYVERRY
jgi:phage gp36-like protein